MSIKKADNGCMIRGSDWCSIEQGVSGVFRRFPRDLHLSEQDVADACCDFIADRLGCMPQDVVVELLYHPNEGFRANVTVRGTPERPMQQLDMIDAIQEFVAANERMSMRSSSAIHVELQFSERRGIYAVVRGV